jgi:H/ACA ribonucleoprotein complex subunit 3
MMHFQLRKCTKCKLYTLKDSCEICSEPTRSVHPAKFSPDDKYLRYRIAEKESHR